MTRPHVIETRYRGFRFRSRLEARWAVFFDTLSVRWQYEQEGFDFGNGDRYLPDFWLPTQQTWVEIKGADPTEREIRVAKQLADYCIRPVAIVGAFWEIDWTLPGASLAAGRIYTPTVAKRASHDEEASLYCCPSCAHFWIESLHDDHWHCAKCGAFTVPMTGGITLASNAAKGARFEHGEAPMMPITRAPRQHRQDRSAVLAEASLVRLFLHQPAAMALVDPGLAERFRGEGYRRVCVALLAGGTTATPDEVAATLEAREVELMRGLLDQGADTASPEKIVERSLESLRARDIAGRMDEIDALMPLAAPQEKDTLTIEKMALGDELRALGRRRWKEFR